MSGAHDFADAVDHEDDHDEEEHSFGLIDALRIIVAGLCTLAVLFGFPDHSYVNFGDQLFLPWSWYGLVGLVFSGWPLFKESWESLLRRRMSMELSMCIAVVAAAWTGYFSAALVIIFFVLLAETVEEFTIERGRRAIRDLMELLPSEAQVRRGGEIVTVPLSAVQSGEIVLVQPGTRIPVDGNVLAGASFVDESRITGEPLPIEKLVGAFAYAGTVNQSGVLEVRAERLGKATSFGQIMESVKEAERSRAPIQRLSDRMATFIVLFAMASAAFEYWLSNDVSSAISVLVVAGACGIAAGTPLALLGAIGQAAKRGAIVKAGSHLEMLGKVDTVVLDKTGTLTLGSANVSKVVPAVGVDAAMLLQAAATVEALSEHPLGKAIIAYAEASGIKPEGASDFAYEPGLGISASDAEGRILVGSHAWLEKNGVPASAVADAGDTLVYVARDAKLLGHVEISDVVRPEARQAVEQLKAMGIDVRLLTGDHAGATAKVAAELGIEHFEADLLPTEKLERIKALQADKHRVAMVGDGINDAPALAIASVGVAMGSGTDVAREEADIVLLKNDLVQFAETIKLARRTRGIIWFNFWGTIAIDLVGIGMAFAGMIGPFEATVIHALGETTFILNSARLIPGSTARQTLSVLGRGAFGFGRPSVRPAE